jgi:hypothetical protein
MLTRIVRLQRLKSNHLIKIERERESEFKIQIERTNPSKTRETRIQIIFISLQIKSKQETNRKEIKYLKKRKKERTYKLEFNQIDRFQYLGKESHRPI